MRLGKKSILALAAIGVVLAGIAAFGLSLINQKPQGRFGIYLLQNNQPVISDEDIVWYNKTSHEMKLTEAGLGKLQALTIPVRGLPFVIKLDGKEVYNGSFWVPVSSVSCNGIVIEIWQDQSDIVEIKKGYPSTEFYTGNDPRNNYGLLEYFREKGKLTQ